MKCLEAATFDGLRYRAIQDRVKDKYPCMHRQPYSAHLPLDLVEIWNEKGSLNLC
ncbi:hypothetical protein GQ55_3G191600 [Panicum hallii var. hallii]|uniref:Uncharacterized protein n=2 Tax=Panicum hallii TaxID=206008 RepID=A0A2T7EB35_9POAL|nr:hypothetical protein GQ55_3G191600 [Panicum hallii var. hallii]PVH62086.1 hypothetical protein PAHAL_3G201900 [Panicum hallii]